MAVPYAQTLRELRVAFSASELETLEKEAAFVRAIERCDGTPSAVQRLIEMGGGLLAEQNRQKSKISDSRRRASQ